MINLEIFVWDERNKLWTESNWHPGPGPDNMQDVADAFAQDHPTLEHSFLLRINGVVKEYMVTSQVRAVAACG